MKDDSGDKEQESMREMAAELDRAKERERGLVAALARAEMARERAETTADKASRVEETLLDQSYAANGCDVSVDRNGETGK